MDTPSSSGYELNNNYDMEFARTPVKQFAKFDYKKLQTFVAAMGLPSNLKRKQLLAIIVAKKMGKHEMIPAILKEVTRQRNQKKKAVKENAARQKAANTASNKRLPPNVAPLPPNVAPLPPQVVSDRASPIHVPVPVPIPAVNRRYVTSAAEPQPSGSGLQYQPCIEVGYPTRSTQHDTQARLQRYLETRSGFRKANESFTSQNYIDQASEPERPRAFMPAPVPEPQPAAEPEPMPVAVPEPLPAHVPEPVAAQMPEPVPVQMPAPIRIAMPVAMRPPIHPPILAPIPAAMLLPLHYPPPAPLPAPVPYIVGPQRLEMEPELIQDIDYSLIASQFTKKISTIPSPTITTTRGIIHMEPSTSTTPWYHHVLSSDQETPSQIYHPSFFVPQRSHGRPASNPSAQVSQAAQAAQNMETAMDIPEQLVDMTLNELKNGSEEINLDTILDYVMGEDKANTEGFTSDSNDTEKANSESESDISNGIHEMHLLYYAQLAHRALWPLKRFIYTYGKTHNYVFDCLSLLNTDTTICFTRSLLGTSNPSETYSIFKPKACIFSNAYSADTTQPKNLPDCCILKPEHSLSYDVPKMYYRSRNYTTEYNSTYALKNYMFQANQQQEDMSRLAYSSMLVDYNIHLPNENAVLPRITPRGPPPRYVDLKPRSKKHPDKVLMNIEPSIQPLTIDEERLAYNSLEDVNSLEITIHDPARYFHQVEHESQCCTAKIPCPFLVTSCGWFDTIPMVAKHIREMHSEKIVTKKTAEYYINFVHLKMLKNRGVKIVQEYNNRLCHVSLCCANDSIFVTIQELCETLDQHENKIKAKFTIKHQSGLRTWTGYISSMIYPKSHLWKNETAMIIPMQHLRYYSANHFRLQVDLCV